MSRETQIEEMARDICRVKQNCNDVCHPINSCRALKYAERFYDASYRKQEWISVDERLPKHEERCLIFTKIHFIPDHVDECNYYEGVEISTFYQDRFLSNNGMYAKYWMPLPEAPKMKGGAE